MILDSFAALITLVAGKLCLKEGFMAVDESFIKEVVEEGSFVEGFCAADVGNFVEDWCLIVLAGCSDREGCSEREQLMIFI